MGTSKNFILKKKAASHIGIILAFVLFVGFVFFLIYFLQPFNKADKLKDATLISLKDNFFELASVNLTSVLVNFSANGNIPCHLDSSLVTGTSSSMGVVSIPTSNSVFSYLYYSDAEDFEDSLSPCPAGDYPLGNVESLEVLSDYSLRKISDDYKADYEKLKSDLELLPTADFSILSVEYILEKRAPDQIKVIAGVYRSPVLYKNGTLINKDFIVKVW